MKNYDEQPGSGGLDGQGVLQEQRVGEETKFLVLHIGGGKFGLEVPYVMEILWDVPISPIPGVPEYYKGVCNWKGKIIPVISLGRKRGSGEQETERKTKQKAGQEPDQRSILVVVREAEYECGFSVRETPKIVSFSEEEALTGEIPPVMEGIVKVKGAYAGEIGQMYVVDVAEMLKSMIVYV